MIGQLLAKTEESRKKLLSCKSWHKCFMAFKKLLYQLKKYKEGYVSSYIKEVLTEHRAKVENRHHWKEIYKLKITNYFSSYANQAKEDIKRRMKLYTSEC